MADLESAATMFVCRCLVCLSMLKPSPDCTEPEAHRAAYKRAKANDVIMASSKPYVPDQAMKIVQSAAETLVLDGTVEQANIGADYISMWPIETEGRAREIAAAFHAALYGLQRLHMAVPSQREAS